ncbi:polymorphic toxin type 50 domain-containing protein (plasmid) [Rhizobium leguminosarum]
MATTNSISYDIRSDWRECPVNERCSLFSSLEEAIAAHDQEFSQLSDLANWKNADGGYASRDCRFWQEVIGSYVDPATGEKIPTTKGIIHRGSKGVRIVPSRP